MRNETIIRVAGVSSVVVLFALYTFNTETIGLQSLSFVLLAIIAVISPEVLDKLPYGPSK